jgi:glucose-6-phosphate isomerase
LAPKELRVHFVDSADPRDLATVVKELDFANAINSGGKEASSIPDPVNSE